MDDSNRSPYKFLDYYTFDDRDIFFGRERETHILLSDVLVSRLVVLFAKTGTGKTSLINAGVRPILEDRGYATFFIRVRKDPELSAELQIIEHDSKPPWTGKTLADKLIAVRRHLNKPIVLFFDQFEEFFLYTLKEQRERGADFVRSIAALYNNLESRIHIVFSMREEWFVEMDVFRTPIPKIFHNESNLRLRWFDKSQTFDATKLPAKAYNVDIEDELVETLYKDLAVEELVEPARLQIVCDTLWRETPGQLTITLEDYQKLGDKNSPETIATQVLFQRLEEEFERLESERELQLLYELLPLLRTQDGTKYVRDIESLVEILLPKPEGSDESEAYAADRTVLLNLLGKLADASFIRKSKRENQDVVELSHDYLVNNLDSLQIRVKAIWPRRRLQRAMGLALPLSLEDFITISRDANLLSISDKEAEFLFRTALAHGSVIELEYLEEWFHRAFRLKIPVWPMLEEQFADECAVETAKLVVDLLSKLAASRRPEGGYDAETLKLLRENAHLLLEKALAQEALVAYTFVMLGYIQTEEAVKILERALAREVYVQQSLDALYRIANSQKNPAVTYLAQETLIAFRRHSIRSKSKLAPLAIDSLGRTETTEAVQLLEEALDDAELSPLAQAALQRLTKAARADVARQATDILMQFLRRSLEPDETASSAVESLGRIATREAVELLEQALKREALALPAMKALESLAGSASPEAAESAYQVLISFLGDALQRDDFAPSAIETLGRVQRIEAVRLLMDASAKSNLASAAQAALQNLSHSAMPQVASEAGEALDRLHSSGQVSGIPAQQRQVNLNYSYEPSFVFIKKLLGTGQIIPFIGPGAALADRAPDMAWHKHESLFLPTAAELASFLAHESLFPVESSNETYDVMNVASYYAEVLNQNRLNERLRQIFDYDYAIGEVHRFLASVEAPLLIFTTSFDDLLERALQKANRPYDVVFHPAGRPDLAGSVLWWRYGEKEPQPISPNQLFVDLSSRTVIYKIFGSVDRISGVWDSYFITEADCVSILSRFTSGVGLPPLFARQLRTRPFLYLGSGLRHWNQRVLLKILKNAASGRSTFATQEEAEPTSYAVQYHPSKLEADLWKAKRVKVIDLDLKEFVRRLVETPES